MKRTTLNFCSHISSLLIPRNPCFNNIINTESNYQYRQLHFTFFGYKNKIKTRKHVQHEKLRCLYENVSQSEIETLSRTTIIYHFCFDHFIRLFIPSLCKACIVLDIFFSLLQVFILILYEFGSL